MKIPWQVSSYRRLIPAILRPSVYAYPVPASNGWKCRSFFLSASSLWPSDKMGIITAVIIIVSAPLRRHLKSIF